MTAANREKLLRAIFEAAEGLGSERREVFWDKARAGVPIVELIAWLDETDAAPPPPHPPTHDDEQER